MSTILQRATNFGGHERRSGNAGLKLAVECVTHFSDEGDWRPMSRLLKSLQYSKADSALMRSILGVCLDDNVKMKKDPKHAELFVFSKKDKDGSVQSNKISMIAELAADGHSFRSTAVKEAISPQKVDKPFDVKKWAHSIALKMKKEGVEMGALMLAVREDIQANS